MYKSIKKKPTYFIIIILLLIVPATIWTIDKTHTLYGTSNFTNDTINFENGTYITAMTSSQLQNIGIEADSTAECTADPTSTDGEVFLYSNAKIILQDGADVGGSIGPLVDFYDFIFIGSIGMFASGAGAAGWLPCDGTEYTINKTTNCQYQKLANRIQNMWGGTGSICASNDNTCTEGNFVGTFRVPDLRGRFLRGANEMASNDYFRYKEGEINSGDPKMNRGIYTNADSYATKANASPVQLDVITPLPGTSPGNSFQVYHHLDDPTIVGQVLEDTSISAPFAGSTFPVGLGYQRSNIPSHDHSIGLNGDVVMDSPSSGHRHDFEDQGTNNTNTKGINILFESKTQSWESDNNNTTHGGDANGTRGDGYTTGTSPTSGPGYATGHFARPVSNLDTQNSEGVNNANLDRHTHYTPFPSSFKLLERTDSGPLDMRPQNVNIGFYIRY